MHLKTSYSLLRNSDNGLKPDLLHTAAKIPTVPGLGKVGYADFPVIRWPNDATAA